MNLKKAATIAAPLVIGGAILSVLGFVSSPSGEQPPAGAAATGAIAPPQDATHERAMLQDQLKQNPGHAPILLRLAEIARQDGKGAEADAYLRELLEGDPLNADARLELGKALYEAGDIDGAIRETKQLVTDHPDNVDGLYNLGAIYANQNQPEQARLYWSQAVAVGPTSESGLKAKNSLQQIGQNSVSLPADFLSSAP
jgi:cytochrome c-type biogenesis protein CcmH/NrfG